MLHVRTGNSMRVSLANKKPKCYWYDFVKIARLSVTYPRGRVHLKSIVYNSRLVSAVVKVKDTVSVRGPTVRQGVALAGTNDSGKNYLDSKSFFEASDGGSQGAIADEE